MPLAYKTAECYTYGDYVNWPDEERWELIDGVAYNMSPAPNRRHQEILGETFRQAADSLVGKPCRAYIAPFDVRLPEADEDDADTTTVVQPDLAVVCDPAKLDDKGCRGAPDFIVEVLSPSTAAKDQIEKVALYERHGVREYWVIHPTDGLVTIHVLGADGRYGMPDVREGKGKIAVTVLSGLEIDLDAVFPEEEAPATGAPAPRV